MLGLKEEIEKGYLKKGRVFEGTRYRKCKLFLVTNNTDLKKKKKFTLLILKYPLKSCINYFTNGPSTYSFCSYYEYCINLINILPPSNESTRTTRRNRKNRYSRFN